jgi:hypothetical protein
MKHKICAIVLSAAIFSSCYVSGYYWQIPEEIQTLEDYQDMIDSFEYEKSYEWQMPDETYSLMSGSCASFSGQLAYIMEYRLNYNKVRIASCINADHMVVVADGIQYEGQTGMPVKEEYEIWYVMTVDEYIEKARHR